MIDMNYVRSTAALLRYALALIEDEAHIAYDECGRFVSCLQCGHNGLRWTDEDALWYCPGCGSEMDRPAYFEHIQAAPPLTWCLEACCQNYPYCSNKCPLLVKRAI